MCRHTHQGTKKSEMSKFYIDRNNAQTLGQLIKLSDPKQNEAFTQHKASEEEIDTYIMELRTTASICNIRDIKVSQITMYSSSFQERL